MGRGGEACGGDVACGSRAARVWAEAVFGFHGGASGAACRAVVRSPRSNGTEFNAGLEMWRGQGAAGEDGLGSEVRFRCAAARDVQDRDAEQDVASTQSEMRRPRLHAGKFANWHDGDDVGRLRGARVTMRNMKRQQF